MDNTNAENNLIGGGFTAISIVTGLFANIAPHVEFLIRCGAGAIAILSGVFAVRYYIYAIQEKKLTIKKLQDGNSQSA